MCFHPESGTSRQALKQSFSSYYMLTQCPGGTCLGGNEAGVDCFTSDTELWFEWGRDHVSTCSRHVRFVAMNPLHNDLHQNGEVGFLIPQQCFANMNCITGEDHPNVGRNDGLTRELLTPTVI